MAYNVHEMDYFDVDDANLMIVENVVKLSVALIVELRVIVDLL